MPTNNSINNTCGGQYFVQNSTTIGDNSGILMGNSDATNAASNCIFDIHTRGTGGDPFIYLDVQDGGANYTFGIDNSDSDTLKITNGATPSAGTLLLSLTTAGAVNIPGTLAVGVAGLAGSVQLQNAKESIGGSVQTETTNTDNSNAASHAGMGVAVGGTSGGDPFVYWTLTGGSSYLAHVDNSDSDKWKLGTGTNPAAGSDIIVATSAGEVTMPLQPAFLAVRSATAINQTGNGAVATLVCDTEIFDQNGDYAHATGIFTAPVTGKYRFTVELALTSATAAMTGGNIRIVTTARTYIHGGYNCGAIRDASDVVPMSIHCLADMTAGDTAYAAVSVSSGAGNTAGFYGDGSPQTYFCGELVC